MKNLLIVFSFLLVSSSGYSQSVEDTQAIQEIVQQMMDAWKEGDGVKFASVFSEKHDFIVWNGFYFSQIGSKENSENHNSIFNRQFKDTEVYYVIDKIEWIKEDVAYMHVLGAVDFDGSGMPDNPAVIWTSLLLKDDGVWRIKSFHNTDLEIYKENGHRFSPIEPEIMYKSWFDALEEYRSN